MNQIFGTNLPKTFYELAMLKIPLEYRDKEPDLYARKWYDYRLLHPTEATYLWAHAYNEQSKKFFAKCKDTATAGSAVGVTAIDAMMSNEATAVWWARHTFDYLGCPYEQALQFLMDRAIDRGHTGMPRPNQLYSMDCMIDVAAWWKERVKTQLTISRAPFMQAVNFEDHPVQVQHLQFIVEQVSKRAKPRDRLVARLMKEGVLDDALAARFFPDEAMGAGKYFHEVLAK